MHPDQRVVDIIARRIANEEDNPKTRNPYKISDVTNEIYRPAVIKELKEVYGIIVKE